MESELVVKLKSVVKRRIVLYIDAANLEQSVKKMWVSPKDIPDELKKYTTSELRWSVDYRKLKNFFQTVGNFQGIRFYTPYFFTDSHHKFLYFLAKGLRFKLTTKPIKEYEDHTPEIPHRKANFDVEIAVDSTFSINDFDTLLLFSGDCDFEYLIKFLRGHGKIVIGFSRSGHVAKELPPALSHYFDVADFRHEILRVNQKAKNPAPDGTGSRS